MTRIIGAAAGYWAGRTNGPNGFGYNAGLFAVFLPALLNESNINNRSIMKKNILCIVMGGGCGQLESASGVLRAMDEAGIVPDKYMGASAGACITGLHSSGVTG